MILEGCGMVLAQNVDTKVPGIVVPVYVEGKEFYGNTVADALKSVESGFGAAFMPQLVDARIAASAESRLWQVWWTAPSVQATGRNKAGKPVVVYAHVPNYFSRSENITQAVKNGLVNGAGRLPQEEFQRLLDLEDNANVFVVEYATLQSADSGLIAVENALQHPQVIPFLGGQERAEAYLAAYERMIGKHIRVYHRNDLGDEPVARLLFLGGLANLSGLDGSDDLNSSARFLGVRGRIAAAGGASQKTGPSLDAVLKATGDFVAHVNQDEMRRRVSALYQ